MAERTGRSSFRRRTGFILVVLGAFLLGTGALLRTFVYDRVAVLPPGVYAVTSLHATGATYFDPAHLKTRKNLDVTAVSTLRGDVAAATNDVAVFDSFLAVQVSDGTPVQFVSSRLAVNRHTGELVTCCGVNINGDNNVHFSGIGFKFPFFARKITYRMWDSDVRRIVPAVFTREQTLDGMRVYRYVQTLQTTQIGSRQVPPSIMHSPSRRLSIPVRQFEATTMTFWIDPVTGAPVKVEQNTQQFLQTLDKRYSLLVFAADLRELPSDVSNTVQQYRLQSTELNVVRNILPPVDLIGGGVLVIIGAFLVLLDRRRSLSAAPSSENAAVEVRTRQDHEIHRGPRAGDL